ncbi:MAG: lysine-sensitive aspartokinase 3 [Bacteroidales bacterium]|jgi:aspartate kinase|nr:lysine-sensitive aspartokinase 3 [Bacteroidales bacterium]
MIVMKFGGTSVRDKEAVERLIKIVCKNSSQKIVVVVSALSGVTDTLTMIAQHAAKGQVEEAINLTNGLEQRHLKMAEELLTGEGLLLKEATETVKQLFAKLNEIVRVISLLEELSDMSFAKILSYGELLSSGIIFRAMLKSDLSCAFADARNIIITDGKYLKGEPQTDLICRNVQELLEREFLTNDVVITQGFISATAEGAGTTLGRGGSDYTAALIGMAANASEIQIWKDVDGVHTTDPKKVKKTRSIPVMSFNEAAELSFFGAKVLHPATIQPAIEKNIPVRVLNSMQPEKQGTLILKDELVHENGVKAISFKENITVINIYSMKMLNAFGFLTRLFEVFGKYGISVDLISTSEVNVSLTVDSERSLDGIVAELSQFAIVSVNSNKSQVSIVGKNLKETTGLAKRIFSAVSDYNITMISQGASDINISFVVNRSDLTPVVSSLHKEFFE